ncbi:hypothetical protein F8388_003465 [Cannabis sativa]|uniref:Reverse transcriptase zinc-binding domain-containing protein n=1 Tax=Cannabis sativa TaxID=3483 RepID=A0A7J6F598_CANSA|nr:hypothetical protein F8388_003465 [Cannabis sativa]
MQQGIMKRLKYAMIRDRFIVPKHRVIIWLALRDRLPTRDRLSRFGRIPDSTCLLCENTSLTSNIYYKYDS